MKHEPENLTLAHEETPASRTDKGVGYGPWLGGLEATCEDCMALMARIKRETAQTTLFT